MVYRALRRLHMGEGEYREPGDIVPEASSWPNPRPWLQGEYIEPVPEEELGAVDAIGVALRSLVGTAAGVATVAEPPSPAQVVKHQPNRRQRRRR